MAQDAADGVLQVSGAATSPSRPAETVRRKGSVGRIPFACGGPGRPGQICIAGFGTRRPKQSQALPSRGCGCVRPGERTTAGAERPFKPKRGRVGFPSAGPCRSSSRPGALGTGRR